MQTFRSIIKNIYFKIFFVDMQIIKYFVENIFNAL